MPRAATKNPKPKRPMKPFDERPKPDRTVMTRREAEIQMRTEWTPQQEAFVKYWAQGESVWAASVKAGYTDGGGFAYHLVKRPEVIARYESEKRKYEEAANMSRKKVMDGLLEAVEMAKLMAEPATMVAGWREIGKMCGYYEPVRARIDVNLSGNVVLDRMNKLSDAELLKIIQQTVGAEAQRIEHDEETGSV